MSYLYHVCRFYSFLLPPLPLNRYQLPEGDGAAASAAAPIQLLRDSSSSSSASSLATASASAAGASGRSGRLLIPGPRIPERAGAGGAAARSIASSQRSSPSPPTPRQSNTSTSVDAEWGGAVSALHGVNPRDPPMLQVLSQLPDFPIVGNQINELLEYRCLGDLLPGTRDLAVYSTDNRDPISHARLRVFIEVQLLLGGRWGVGGPCACARLHVCCVLNCRGY